MMKILKKRYKFRLFICLFILSFTINILPFGNASSSISLSQDCESKESSIVPALILFAEALGKTIDKNQLIYELGYQPAIRTIMDAARSQGIFLSGFKLTLYQLSRVSPPFIVSTRTKGYCLVKKIAINDDGAFISYITPQEDILTKDIYEFGNIWNGYILSLPLMDILAERIRDNMEKRVGRFISIYSYHSGEKFEELKPILDKLREEAQNNNQRFIFVDELGLIPKETVLKKRKRLKITEEEAFEQIKQSIFRENKMLEKGIPLRIGSEFYRDFYAWMAKNRVRSYVENLSYKNWKDIVAFDKLFLYNQALNYFILGDIQGYLDTLEKHTRGFWKYNIYIRDEKFARQIEDLMRKYPNSIIFTLRGIGHYGLEKMIEKDNFKIEILNIGEGRLKDNFIGQQFLKILWSNEVDINPEEKRLLLLRSLPHEYLRAHFQKTYDHLSLSTRKASRIVERIDEADMVELSRDKRQAILRNRIKYPDDLSQFVFEWTKGRGLIKNQCKK